MHSAVPVCSTGLVGRREMAASFDLGQSEGRDRFPNLDQARGHLVECVQVCCSACWMAHVCMAH